MLLPSLNSYFLGAYQFDTGDTLATRTATISPTDATGQNVAIKAGYAEYGTEDKDNNHFWLRAGRQTRSDGGAMFAYFDGATVGYRNDDVSASAFAGQRVALYIDTPTGVTFGGTASLDLKKWKNIPVKLGLDYEALTIATGTVDVPTIDTTVARHRRDVPAPAARGERQHRSRQERAPRPQAAARRWRRDRGRPARRRRRGRRAVGRDRLPVRPRERDLRDPRRTTS